MVVAEELKVLFTGDNSPLARALDSAKKDVAGFGGHAKNVFGGLASIVGAIGVAKLGSDLIGTSAAFEDAFLPVRQTVQGTKEELDALNVSLRQMAKETPTTAEGLDRIAEKVGELGVRAPDVAAVTDAVNDFALATSTATDQATESLLGFVRAMGLAPKQAASVASAVVTLADRIGAPNAAILEFSTRIGQTARAIGLTERQALALGAVLAHVGVDSARGGSAFNKVLGDMSAAVQAGGKELEVWARVAGVSAEEFAKRFRTDAGGALQGFLAGLKRVKDGGGDTLATLRDLGLDSTLLADSILKAADASGTLTQAFQLSNSAFQDHSDLQEDVAKKTDTTASKMQVMKNRIEDAKARLGDALVPAMVALTEAVGPLAFGIGALADGFNSLPVWVKDFIIGLALAVGGLTVAVKAYALYQEIATAASLLFGTSQTTQAAQTAAATTAITAKTAALQGATVAEAEAAAAAAAGGGAAAAGAGGLTLMAGAAAAAAGALVGLGVVWELQKAGIMDGLANIGQDIGGHLGDAAKPVQAGASLVLAPLVAIGAGIMALVKGEGWDGFKANLEQAFAPAMEYLGGLGSWTWQAGRNFVDGLTNGVRSGWDSFTGALGDAAEGTKDFFAGLFGIRSPSRWFADMGRNMVAGLEQGVEGLEETFGTPLANVKAVVTGDVAGLQDSVRSALVGMQPSIQAAIQVPEPAGIAAQSAATRGWYVSIDKLEVNVQVPVSEVRGGTFDPETVGELIADHTERAIRQVVAP